MSSEANDTKDRILDCNRTFNVVLWMVCILTVFFAILACCFEKDMRFTAFMDLAKVGFGAIVGLLGGRQIK